MKKNHLTKKNKIDVNMLNLQFNHKTKIIIENKSKYIIKQHF